MTHPYACSLGFSLIAVLVSAATACSGGGGTGTDGGTEGGPSCSTTGTGTLNITISGLPAAATGSVHVAGSGTPQDVTATGSLTLPAGTYTLTASRVVLADPLVRTVYIASISSGTAGVCVADGQTQTVTVTYALVPTSNKVWTPNGPGGNGDLLGFASAGIGASGTPAASVASMGPAGRDVAFDQDGNAWAFGASSADAMIARFPAASFAASGAITPDRKINIPSLVCLPPTAAMAFDANGNLWVSSPCGGNVLRVSADQLGASGDVTPGVTLTGAQAPTGLAFDKNGNLWVADSDGDRIRRYDAAHLGANATAADLSIQAMATQSSGTLPPSFLAFDKDGNLWANNFGGNVYYEVSAGDLTGTGDHPITPVVEVTFDAGPLLEGFAFDEGGGLWTAYSAGKFARLSPAQLLVSTTGGSPTIPDTIIASPDVGYAAKMALYPAPAALPLYDALP